MNITYLNVTAMSQMVSETILSDYRMIALARLADTHVEMLIE